MIYILIHRHSDQIIQYEDQVKAKQLIRQISSILVYVYID
jgi:hypothetical protein